MKLTKICAALIALGVVSSASADNIIYVTGSTAFRGNAYTAIKNMFDSAPTEAEWNGSSASGAQYMVFHGNINTTPTYVNCRWSGSEAGIAATSGVTVPNTDRDGNTVDLDGAPCTFIDVSKVTLDGTVHSAQPTTELMASSQLPDLTFADTSQAVSLTPRVANTATDLKNYGVVGIVTFTWVKNYNTAPSTAWNNLSNISQNQVRAMLSAGSEPASFFTGVHADTNQWVYLVGRNKGSGTRANTLVDHAYGPTTKPVIQYSIGEGIEVPKTGTLLLQYEANNGYEGGGDVAGALSIDGSCGQQDPFTLNSGWMAVGYLGTGDATKGNLTMANNWLTLDGVMESDGAIEEGKYPFWGHEHLYGRYGISGVADTFGQSLVTAVQNSLSTAGSNPAANSSGINLIYMNAQKGNNYSDTAYPTPK